jgi:uncharacterized membrane protein HdeD (DUF308 family)
MSNRLFEEVFRGAAAALIIRGIAAVLFGILVLLWPDVPVLALVLLFGVYALIDGVAGTVDWFRRRTRRSPWALAGNAISIIAGIVAVLWPGITALALTFLIGCWAVLLGVSQIGFGSHLRRMYRPWWLWFITGVITALFGLYLVIFPGLGILSLLGLLSAMAIITGILIIVSGLWLLRIGKTGGSGRGFLSSKLR